MMQPLGSFLLLTVLLMPLSVAAKVQGSPADAGDAADGAVDPLVIQRAARQYRMQLYHSFRLDRAEYDRRRAAWEQVVAAWEAAGSRADQRPLLLAWLQAAIANASPGTAKPSPAIPTFETVKESRTLLVDPLPVILAAPPPPVTGQELHLHPSPAVEVHLDQRVWLAGAQRLSMVEDSRPSVEGLAKPVLVKRERLTEVAGDATPREPWPNQATSGERFRRIMTKRELPGVEEGELVSQTTREEGKPAAGTLKDSASMSVEKASAMPVETRAVGEGTPVVAPPTRPWLPRREGAWNVELPAVESHRPLLASIPRRQPVAPALDRLPGPESDEVRAVPVAPQAVPNSQPAPVAPRAIEPRRVVRLPTPAPVASIPLRQPAVPPSMKEPAGQGALVNRNELAARILGGNLALRECEAELDVDKPWDAARLAPLVLRLKRVVIQRHDCLLLYDLLSESERSLIDAIESPKPVIRILSQRIVEARQRAKTASFPAARRTAELQALDELTQTVSELVQKWLE